MIFEAPTNNQENSKDIKNIEQKNTKSDLEMGKGVDEKRGEKLEEINGLKRGDYEKSQEELRKIRESIGNNEMKDKKIEGFNEAYVLVEKEIDNILSNKEKALVSLAGKSGSGKTFFSEELKNRLMEKGRSAILISSDNFYKEHKNIEDKVLDVEKLQNEIKKMQEEFDIVLVEGFQTIDNSTLGQKPDFKTFIDSSFGERLATKLDRDSKTFRSLEESLDLIVKAFVYNPEIGKKFEGDIDMSDVDLEIVNNYKNPNNPELYIQNNELVFSSLGETKKRVLSDEEFEVLKKAGIKSL
jgi:chromosomal replication initiation ATPase DnaA